MIEVAERLSHWVLVSGCSTTEEMLLHRNHVLSRSLNRTRSFSHKHNLEPVRTCIGRGINSKAPDDGPSSSPPRESDALLYASLIRWSGNRNKERLNDC